jgi:hypothetical protein
MPVFAALAGGKVALYRPLVQISVQVSSRKTQENEKKPNQL